MRRTIAFVCVALGACVRADPSPATGASASTAGVADSVRAATTALLAAVGARDSARVVSFFAADSGMRLIEGAVMTRDEVAGMAGAAYRAMTSIESAMEGPLHVAVLSPEAAVASGRYRDVFVDAAGKRTEARGTGTWVWVLRAGRWQIIHQHATPDVTGGSG